MRACVVSICWALLVFFDIACHQDAVLDVVVCISYSDFSKGTRSFLRGNVTANFKFLFLKVLGIN